MEKKKKNRTEDLENERNLLFKYWNDDPDFPDYLECFVVE